MDDSSHYKKLVERYLDNTASEEELQVFFHLLAENKLDEYLQQAGEKTPLIPMRTRRLKWVKRYSIAASIVLIVATTIFFVASRKNGSTQDKAIASIEADAAPGSRKARLILGDGKELLLDDSRQQLITDGGVTIESRNSELHYTGGSKSAGASVNMIITPKGGEYKVQLPDGSVVWLNAGTSLRYPSFFSGKERIVELDGEAYFEVAKNPAKPFIVKSAQGNVRVLGTHFNIRAYKAEGVMKTTLAEGSVVLQQNGTAEKLQPGESGTITQNSNAIAVAAANVSQDLAWKDGWFYFDKTPLQEIMAQIGRWYDIDVRYEGNVTEKRFVGKINRNARLAEVLNILRLSDLHFTMQEKVLIVKE